MISINMAHHIQIGISASELEEAIKVASEDIEKKPITAAQYTTWFTQLVSNLATASNKGTEI